MTTLILVQAAQTDWRVQGRMAGDTDLPLNEYGHRQAVADAQTVAHHRPTLIRCGPEQPTKQTAALIAHELGLKLRTVKELREMDLGHWEGLTFQEFRDRFAKVDRQWRSEPTSVEPPEGEAVPIAAARLEKAVNAMVKRHAGESIVLVLGLFAGAIVRCRLQDRAFEHFWQYVDGEPKIQVISYEGPPPP